MIKFALVCSGGHEFESWFQNGAAFDMQAQAGLILCPVCRAPQVTKAIMSPAIANRGRDDAPPAPAAPQGEPSANVALLSPRDQELRAMIEDLRKRIFEQTDDVGARFSDEARKISPRRRPRTSYPRLGEFRGSERLARGGGWHPAHPAASWRL